MLTIDFIICYISNSGNNVKTWDIEVTGILQPLATLRRHTQPVNKKPKGHEGMPTIDSGLWPTLALVSVKWPIGTCTQACMLILTWSNLHTCILSLNMKLVVAQKQTTSWEILLWMTPSEAPKALQASECSELLDPTRANCWISAQHQPGKFMKHGHWHSGLFMMSFFVATTVWWHSPSKLGQTATI